VPLLAALGGPAPGSGPHVGHFYGIHGVQGYWVLAVIGGLRLGAMAWWLRSGKARSDPRSQAKETRRGNQRERNRGFRK
jgi:hypothetical protein